MTVQSLSHRSGFAVLQRLNDDELDKLYCNKKKWSFSDTTV